MTPPLNADPKTRTGFHFDINIPAGGIATPKAAQTMM
jgi:hypothetical protein